MQFVRRIASDRVRPSVLSITRSLLDLAEKSARSTIARLSVSDSARSMCRCTTRPSNEFSSREFFSIHCACAIVASARKKNAALSFRTVLVDQSLKTRIAAQRVPRRTKFENLHGERAGPAQQSIQELDCTVVFAHDATNFGHAGRDFRAAKSVFTLRKYFGGAAGLI